MAVHFTVRLVDRAFCNRSGGGGGGGGASIFSGNCLRVGGGGGGHQESSAFINQNTSFIPLKRIDVFLNLRNVALKQY